MQLELGLTDRGCFELRFVSGLFYCIQSDLFGSEEAVACTPLDGNYQAVLSLLFLFY